MATMVGEFELYNDACQDEADIQKVIFWKRPNTDVEVTIVRPSWTDDTMVLSLADVSIPSMSGHLLEREE